MIACAGEDVTQRNTLPLLVGLKTYIDTIKINMVFPQKVTNQSTSKSNYSTLRHIPNRFFILPQGQLYNHDPYVSIIARN